MMNINEKTKRTSKVTLYVTNKTRQTGSTHSTNWVITLVTGQNIFGACFWRFFSVPLGNFLHPLFIHWAWRAIVFLCTAHFIIVRVKITFFARGATSHILPCAKWTQGGCCFPTSWTKGTLCRVNACCFNRLFFFVVVFASVARIPSSKMKKEHEKEKSKKVKYFKFFKYNKESTYQSTQYLDPCPR